MHDKGVDKLIESGWWHSRRETGKERVWGTGKEGESGLREKSIFLLLCDHVFHSILPPFQPTMSPLFFLCSHTPHHHTTHHLTTSVLSSFFFVCDCQCTQSTLNQTTQHHTTMQSPHMAQPMDDATSEWERAVVIEDTTPQTPSTTMK
jgi:hypothetical protein